MKPVVSVVITTYNRPNKCKRAIESVLSQTYSPLEIIVVEDGTETGIYEWIRTEHPYIQYIRHDSNRGLAAARNTGLEQSEGEYVAYLDDDDVWKPARIEKQIDALESHQSREQGEVGVVYCGTERRTSDGDLISIGHPENSGNLRESIKSVGASTLSSSFLFTRKCLIEVDGFDQTLPSSIDHDIWMSLAIHNYHTITVDEPLVITYESNEKDMMTNTYPRISGVRQYVKKWTPTYHDWFGVEQGNIHGERYFARVIARLVSEKAANGDLIEAWHAIRAIYDYSSQYQYNTYIITTRTTRAIATKNLPEPIVGALRSLKNLV